MLEKLQVPNLDEIISVVGALHCFCPDQALSEWVIDEKAFRQVPVLPSHRHLAMVAACSLEREAVVYFVMLSTRSA